jgi:DnaJ-domain-containing protein 1
MAGAFKYRPKFVDIRVKKPEAEPARGEGDVPCDHMGCRLAGAHRAPKSRERANEYWHFCREHAGEYNRRWNYFEGMSEEDFVHFQRSEEVGHRPVWTFRPGRQERISPTRFWKAAEPGDRFGLFGRRPAPEQTRARRSLSNVHKKALEALHLDETADAQAIRARYAEQVKRWHPDSNGGDRSAEQMLQKAVQAYQTLKKSGLA